MTSQMNAGTFLTRATGLSEGEFFLLLSDANGTYPSVYQPITSLADSLSRIVLTSIREVPNDDDSARALGLTDDEIGQMNRKHEELHQGRLQLGQKLKNLSTEQATLAYGYLIGFFDGRPC